MSQSPPGSSQFNRSVILGNLREVRLLLLRGLPLMLQDHLGLSACLVDHIFQPSLLADFSTQGESL